MIPLYSFQIYFVLLSVSDGTTYSSPNFGESTLFSHCLMLHSSYLYQNHEIVMLFGFPLSYAFKNPKLSVKYIFNMLVDSDIWFYASPQVVS